jgi:hypothetical protein
MNNISMIRKKIMQTRKIVCTGNPDNPTKLASGFRKIFPDTTFIHLSNGWDLTDHSPEAQNRLKELFSKHNTFINASYIAPGVQSWLLDVYNQSVKIADVFNIGSTHEYDEFGIPEYAESKLALRDKSLCLNTYRFQTHHILLGMILGEEGLGIDTICGIVPWIMDQSFKVPLICIDPPKAPW